MKRSLREHEAEHNLSKAGYRAKLRRAQFESGSAPKTKKRSKNKEALQKQRSTPKTKKHSRRSASVGAATQIRTGDLILTKDVLYQLSHSSVNRKDYSRDFLFCQAFLLKKTNFFQNSGSRTSHCKIPSKRSAEAEKRSAYRVQSTSVSPLVQPRSARR